MYNITISGTLFVGDSAILFIESICPQYSMIPQNQPFTTNTPNTINVNFRAITDLTVIGILFATATANYCLQIDELKVTKLDDSLQPTSATGNSICERFCPPTRPGCNIVDPPTVNQLVPKSSVLCVSDFIANISASNVPTNSLIPASNLSLIEPKEQNHELSEILINAVRRNNIATVPITSTTATTETKPQQTPKQIQKIPAKSEKAVKKSDTESETSVSELSSESETDSRGYDYIGEVVKV